MMLKLNDVESYRSTRLRHQIIQLNGSCYLNSKNNGDDTFDLTAHSDLFLKREDTVISTK